LDGFGVAEENQLLTNGPKVTPPSPTPYNRNLITEAVFSECHILISQSMKYNQNVMKKECVSWEAKELVTTNAASSVSVTKTDAVVS
jgi:hypothetical protein